MHIRRVTDKLFKWISFERRELLTLRGSRSNRKASGPENNDINLIINMKRKPFRVTDKVTL